jgi:F0F1-type ATP synthase assembly protein I
VDPEPRRHSAQDGDQHGQEDGAATRRRQAQAYQGAVEAVFAILIAGGLGYLADRHFGTSPLLLLIGFGIGFAAFVLRLVRLGRAMQVGGGEPTDMRGGGAEPPDRP